MLHDPAFGWVGTVKLRDGRQVFVRPARLGDEPLIQAFVRGLSVDSRYQRFFLPLQELPPDHLKRLTQSHPKTYAALLAFDSSAAHSPRVAGIVEYGAEIRGEACELAVVVSEDWRRQGLALRLMKDLADVAAANGFTRVVIDVLRANVPALELARRFGAVPGRSGGAFSSGSGVVRLSASLPSAAHDGPMARLPLCRPRPAVAAQVSAN
ncbi:MAG: hypothetical protein C5B46_03715 [Proteobacteria bacterium]|nr:MAG: hypothetical protein C5B46_03715 [Pseudomonadota bacterium]